MVHKYSYKGVIIKENGRKGTGKWKIEANKAESIPNVLSVET
jgi:precorrin-6x reductase